METKKLFYITMTSGLLMVISLVWSIVELFTVNYNYWSIGSFGLLFFITEWLGVTYAYKVMKDFKGTVDSFNPRK